MGDCSPSHYIFPEIEDIGTEDESATPAAEEDPVVFHFSETQLEEYVQRQILLYKKDIQQSQEYCLQEIDKREALALDLHKKVRELEAKLDELANKRKPQKDKKPRVKKPKAHKQSLVPFGKQGDWKENVERRLDAVEGGLKKTTRIALDTAEKVSPLGEVMTVEEYKLQKDSKGFRFCRVCLQAVKGRGTACDGQCKIARDRFDETSRQEKHRAQKYLELQVEILEEEIS